MIKNCIRHYDFIKKKITDSVLLDKKSTFDCKQDFVWKMSVVAVAVVVVVVVVDEEVPFTPTFLTIFYFYYPVTRV